MPRPLFDTPYIFGIHEPGGENHMLEAGKPGWIIFTESIGSEPGDTGGKDFSQWSNQGLGVLCRINNGYYPGGTIPHSSRYEDFARRCANYAAASRGCKIWIIGNEMNHPVERPGVDIDWGRSVRPQDPVSIGRSVPWRFNALEEGTRSSRMAILNQGETITPQLYARCYKLCRDAIHSRPGHENDQVLIGSVAPWNNLTKYDGNPNGDWVQYFGDILKLLGPQNCDGITVHAYTHSSNPAEIYTDQFMDSPFNRYQFNFRTYRDFMNAVPASMRHLPAYITETDQDQPWKDENNSWVQRAYGEIDAWNKQPGKQQIRALILYRWPNIDRWVIEGKNGVIQDFRESLGNSYQWRDLPVPEPEPPHHPSLRSLWARRYTPSPRSTSGRRPALRTSLRATSGSRSYPKPNAQSSEARRLSTTWSGGRCAAPLPASSTRAGPPRPHPPDPNSLPPRSLHQTPNRSLNPSQNLNPCPRAANQGGRQGQDAGRQPTCGRRLATRTSRTVTSCTRSRLNQSLSCVAGPSTADALVWWSVRFTSSEGNTFSGWVAGAKASGALLLAAAPAEPTAGAASRQFRQRPSRQFRRHPSRPSTAQAAAA